MAYSQPPPVHRALVDRKHLYPGSISTDRQSMLSQVAVDSVPRRVGSMQQLCPPDLGGPREIHKSTVTRLQLVRRKRC